MNNEVSPVFDPAIAVFLSAIVIGFFVLMGLRYGYRWFMLRFVYNQPFTDPILKKWADSMPPDRSGTKAIAAFAVAVFLLLDAVKAVNAQTPTGQAYAELQAAFDHYNNALFDGQLPPCLITMQREKRTYGYFSSRRFIHRQDKSTTDEIALNPSYFGVVPLLEILQTIVHEMAHAWQFHFGEPGRRGYHNKEWAEKMEAIGLMPSSTGKPGGAKTGEKMADYAIEGGPFMLATAELLTTDFRISWLDRVTPAQSGVVSILDGTDGGEDGEDTELAAMLTPAAGSRSNRDKYRCPCCKAQAWGKPGLSLLCGVEGCKAAAFELVEN